MKFGNLIDETFSPDEFSELGANKVNINKEQLDKLRKNQNELRTSAELIRGLFHREKLIQSPKSIQLIQDDNNNAIFYATLAMSTYVLGLKFSKMKHHDLFHIMINQVYNYSFIGLFTYSYFKFINAKKNLRNSAKMENNLNILYSIYLLDSINTNLSNEIRFGLSKYFPLK